MSTDNKFGPQLPGVFDFTLLFEQSILSLLPTALFITLVPSRLLSIYKKEPCVKPGLLLWSKLTVIALYGCLQIPLVVLWSTNSAIKTNTSIAESAVAVVEAFFMLALSYFEHIKSPKPSALLNSYLILSILLDIALTRTFWIRDDMKSIAAVFTASLVLKVVLLFLEETPKRQRTDSRVPVRESSAGVISRSLLWWINPLMISGSRRILEVEDLEPVHDKFDSRYLLQRLEKAWELECKKPNPSLMGCTLAEFKWPFIMGMFPRLLYSAFSFAQPFLIQSVILKVGEPETELSLKTGSGLIGATALIYIGLAVSGVWYRHLSFQLVTMYRGALSSLIFHKTLRLKTEGVKENAPVTLMSTDVETITASGESFQDVWANFVDLPIGIYLLYRQVGKPSLLVLIPTVVNIILSGICSPAMEPATAVWNEAIQKRVGETSVILGQMKAIKMMGLTDYAYNLIHGLRIHEIRKASAKYRWLLAGLVNLTEISNQLSPLIVILTSIYWRGSGGLSVAEAFTSISIISLVTQPLALLLVSIAQVAGIAAGFGRIQAFMELEERRAKPSIGTRAANSSAKSDERGLMVKSVESRDQTPSDNAIQLDEVDSAIGEADPAIDIKDATFTTSDGTALLQNIDLQIPRGSFSVLVGKIGCGKSSLLRAILGELNTKAGSVLASADLVAYCDQNPWLRNATVRDNIIGQSALDEKLLASVLRACTLDEDIASNFPDGDLTLVGSGGVALSGGQKQRLALARALYSRKRIYLLDDIFSGLDNNTSNTVFQRLLGPGGWLRKNNITVVLATHTARILSSADFITLLDEGKIVHNQTSYDVIEPYLEGVLGKGKARVSIEKEETEPPVIPTVGAAAVPLVPEKDLGRQTGDIECYKIYLQSLGSLIIAIIFISSATGAVLEAMPNIWLKFWTGSGGDPGSTHYLAGYIGFVLSAMFMSVLYMSFFFIVGAPKSCIVLHEKLLRTACRAPLYFFSTTDSGTTLNRFSQDMHLIDGNLPLAFILTIGLCFRVVVEAGIVCSGASYAGTFLPFAIICLYLIQKYYLRTSRQMRFLDIESKAPLYTQFTETLAGLATIRAFGWSESLMLEYHRSLNTSQKPFYLMFCIQRWLQVVLDMFVAGVAVFLVSLALRVSGASTQGSIGLALVNLVGFNQTLTILLDQWTQLETSLGAIARLKMFAKDTPDENKEAEKGDVPADWPTEGSIELKAVSASYGDETSLVLRDVSLTIQQGQKVCVCGRSGSGKSSLLLTILRLLETRSGTILIDDVDLATIPRQEVRSRITTLCQDPLKLSGSIRRNLDPEDHIQADEMLINALKKATIWPIIEARGGLDALASDIGFSVGQQQLFSLARALLSRNRIVFLDEATSSVDAATEKEVHRIINEELNGRTIIHVAHRLQFVKDFDVAVVMGDGKVLETGKPETLLEQDSALKALFDAQDG